MSESLKHFAQLFLGLLGFAIMWAVMLILIPFMAAILFGQMIYKFWLEK